MVRAVRTVGFLASVTNESEARLCAALGADIIDAKNPAQGALGALPGETVRAIRAAVPDHIAVSATVGDPPDETDGSLHAVRFMAAAGVDFVKVGLWPGQDEIVRQLARLARSGGVRLVGVLLVDRGLDLGLIAPLGKAGFAGVMLDTSDKQPGALPDRIPAERLQEFVSTAHAAGLFAGLAGSLRAAHVENLSRSGADVLGFRGGLCREGVRSGAIDAEAVRAVRAALSDHAVPCAAERADAMARWQPERAV
jgi:(5-formylfuran-3-yl)methyl phosphate synthase